MVRAAADTPQEMRRVYAETMIEMAKEDPRVVVLDSDLLFPIGMSGFKEKYPERTFDCGIMEANMTGVAAGMSACGCIPFTHTFGCFQGRKCLDQIYLTAGFADLNVKIVGTDPGVLAAYNGASHMALEDMGILMNVPNLTLVEPCDVTELRYVLRKAKDTYGLFYIRMNRKMAATIYDPSTDFELGKGIVLREGKDVTIVTSGIMVAESLKAAEQLALEGMEARVVDLFTWRPLDTELLVESAKQTGAIVVAENHRRATGLGSAVAYALGEEKVMVPIGRVGVEESYGEVGDEAYLKRRFGLTAEHIVAKVKETVSCKA